jgi:hypothetical protein
MKALAHCLKSMPSSLILFASQWCWFEAEPGGERKIRTDPHEHPSPPLIIDVEVVLHNPSIGDLEMPSVGLAVADCGHLVGVGTLPRLIIEHGVEGTEALIEFVMRPEHERLLENFYVALGDSGDALREEIERRKTNEARKWSAVAREREQLLHVG